MPVHEQPVLSSPYLELTRHHALGEGGQPLNHPPIEGRRRCGYVAPVPKARKQKQGKQEQWKEQQVLDLGALQQDGSGRAYGVTEIVDEIRQHLATWRAIPNPADWAITPSTARLLQHWHNPPEEALCPFFCQVEGVETIICLTEVARSGRQYSHIWKQLEPANADINSLISTARPCCFSSREHLGGDA